MPRPFTAFLGNRDGATAIEYGLIVALTALVIITILGLFGDQMQASFQHIADTMAQGW